MFMTKEYEIRATVISDAAHSATAKEISITSQFTYSLQHEGASC